MRFRWISAGSFFSDLDWCKFSWSLCGCSLILIQAVWSFLSAKLLLSELERQLGVVSCGSDALGPWKFLRFGSSFNWKLPPDDVVLLIFACVWSFMCNDCARRPKSWFIIHMRRCALSVTAFLLMLYCLLVVRKPIDAMLMEVLVNLKKYGRFSLWESN